MSASLETQGGWMTDLAGGVWRKAILVVAVCLAALGAIFHQEVVGAFQVWVGSATYNHCFLIIPIALFMIWQRRELLVGVAPRPEYRALLLIPLLSLAWFADSVFGVLEIRQFVVMTIVQATLLGILGWRVYRLLMAPLLYLYFLVPSGEFLVPSLQDFTANFAVKGLQLVGIPVFSDGTVIDIPAGTFAVAEACAGLRFLVAAVAFGVFYATEIYQSPVRRAIYMALSVVVPIIANGLRAFGLIAAAEAFGSATAIEADHITYGWIFFSMVLVALIFIGRIFSDRDGSPPKRDPEQRPMAPARRFAMALTGLLAVLLAAVGPALGDAIDKAPARVVLKSTAPNVAMPWQRLANGASNWHPRVMLSDREFADTFTDGSVRVDRYVALYLPRGRDNNLIRSDNRIADLEHWNITARGRAVAQIGSERVPVNTASISGGGKRRLVWWFYVVDGTTAASVYDVKRHQVHAYLTRSGCPSAFVAVSTDLVATADAERTLNDYLRVNEPMEGYLCGSR